MTEEKDTNFGFTTMVRKLDEKFGHTYLDPKEESELPKDWSLDTLKELLSKD